MIEISIDKIFMSYAFNEVLKGFSFKINTGEKIALIGSNGTGKTTLFRLITGEEKPNKGSISVRKVSSIGYLKQIPPLEKNGVSANEVYLRGISYLLDMENELRELERNMSHHENIINKYTKLRETFEVKGGYELNKKINTIKNAFKLTDDLMSREYNKLSGGEKTIINLASLILSSPDILLLDEPTNHLDIDTLEWLEEFLKSYKGTVLIISHDRYFLDKIVNKTVCISDGIEDVYYGNYSYYLVESEKRMLIEFQNYKNQQKEIKALKEAIARLKVWGQMSDNPLTFKRMHAMEKRIERMEIINKPYKKKKLPINFKESKRSSNHVISIKGLNLSIGDKKLLFDSSAELMYQDRLCLMGKNGSGKSTLIKEIMNNNNESISVSNSCTIGYIPQEIRFDDESLSIYEHMKKIFLGNEEELRSKLFQFYFGNETISKKLKNLSGGEKVRIKLLELIVKNTNLLILDEPTNHIDIETKELLENSLLEFTGTILFISHDRYFINKIATKIVRIENKKLVSYDGNYDSIKDKTIIEENENIKVKPKIIINGSNRLNSYVNDSKIDELEDGFYRLKKKSKVYYLLIDNHLSEESIKMDYLEGKIKIPKKVFYEKYNDKSYILTESLKGQPLNSDYFINNPEEGIKVVIEAFNSVYSIDYSDCIFDEMIDSKLKRIESTTNLESKVDGQYKNRFVNKRAMCNYLKGNKIKSVIGFTHGNMLLDNIYSKDGHFSGIDCIKKCGICDIYYDIVSMEISVNKYYGNKYVDLFYKELGIEKDEIKSEYYKMLMYLKN